MLASRAIIAGALANNAPTYWLSAAGAGLAQSIIHPEQWYEETRVAVLADEIPQRRAAPLDGLVQGIPHRHGQPLVSPGADAARGAGWMDSGAVKRLAGIDVAHAHDDTAVHDERLGGNPAAPGLSIQVVAVEGLGQRFGAQGLEQWMPFRRPGRPQHAAEPSGVAKSQASAVVELDIQVIVLFRPPRTWQNPQAARHAEMNHQVSAIHPDQQVLGPAVDALDALARQLQGKPARHRPAQPVLPDAYGGNEVSPQVGLDTPADGLYFRQLGQCCDDRRGWSVFRKGP